MFARSQSLSSNGIKHISIDIPIKHPTPLEPKQKSYRQYIKDTYSEFCANTSIHGFQYFGQHRPWKEIFFWIVVFVVSIYFCSSMIVKVYVKWYETPVIVTLSEKSTPIWNIPFPAITICPETKRGLNETGGYFRYFSVQTIFSYSPMILTPVPSYLELMGRLKNYLNNNQRFDVNFTSSDLVDILTLLHLCEVETNISIPTFEHPPIDIIHNLNKMLPNFQKYCFSCGWFGVEGSCENFFVKVYTDEGICFTFNSLKSTDLYRENTFQYQLGLEVTKPIMTMFNRSLSWTLEEGYDPDEGLDTYPARVLGSGFMAGFAMSLQNFASEVDYSCRYVADGFKILLHSPDDMPSMAKHFVHVSMGKDVMISVKPKMITTSAGIAEYEPHQRQCYLNKDRPLKYFKIYSQSNCEQECLTDFTLNLCGCVTFSMPRTPETPVCDVDKIPCYRRAKDKLLFNQFSEALKKIKHKKSEENYDCDCLPACTTLDYETEISEGSFNVENTINAVDHFEVHRQEHPDLTMSIMWIYFKENQFITSRRSELYGITDLLANFGGVCGLFMGVSLLSVIEIVYHFTLRLWSNMRRRRVVI